MTLRAIIVLLLLIWRIATYGAQVPSFSGFQFALHTYNPAYAGFNNRIEGSFLGGVGKMGRNDNDAMYLILRNTQNKLKNSEPLKNPNYLNYNINVPIRLNKSARLGVALFYINNDLNRIETDNTAGVSIAYNHKSLEKGRFSYGVNYKRRIIKASDIRIYNLFTPEYTAIFNSYKENFGTFDIGILFQNDSGTFDFGVSAHNARRLGFGKKSQDEIYILIKDVIPQFVFNSNYKFNLGSKFQSNNSILFAVSTKIEHPQLMINSILEFEKLGVGGCFEYSFYKKLGPIISYKFKNFDILYTYKSVLGKNVMISGLHEIGIRLRYNSDIGTSKN